MNSQSILLPNIHKIRSNSDSRLKYRDKIKTVSDAVVVLDSPNKHKSRLIELNQRTERKGAAETLRQLEKQLHKKLKAFHEPDSDSSDQVAPAVISKKNLITELAQIRDADVQKDIQYLRQRIKTQLQQSTVFQEQPLTGAKAVDAFYSRHKFLKKEEQKQALAGKVSSITFILQLLEKFSIPPKRLQIIKEKGSNNVLQLRSCGVGHNNHAKLLHQLLENITTFAQIDLSQNYIQFDTAEIILPNCKNIRVLKLSHNKIGKSGCEVLGRMFGQGDICHIQCLELDSNELLDTYAVEIVKGLFGRVNYLRKLDLSRNYIGNVCASQLGLLLSGNYTVIEQLYLHWNEINQIGAVGLMAGMTSNKTVKVLDLSWNHMQEAGKLAGVVAQFFSKNNNCLHFDLSYCNILAEDAMQIKKGLELNISLMGFHFQGNAGYVDLNGFLNVEETPLRKYPQPVGRHVLRRIRGVEPNPESSHFSEGKSLDMCWICMGYQQFQFQIASSKLSDDIECFLHLDIQNFRGIKMNLDEKGYFLRKMVPRKKILFFFTYERDDHKVSPKYTVQNGSFKIPQFRIGKVEYRDVKLSQMNTINLDWTHRVIAPESYNILVNCRPRQKENRIMLRRLALRKKLIEKEENLKFELKVLPSVIDDEPSEDSLREMYKKCLQHDISNSKILKIINASQMPALKTQILKHYKFVLCAYKIISSNNCTPEGAYSIPQQGIMDFSEEAKLVTKRIPLSKIIVKYCGAVGSGTMYRPQFVQFLVRVAEEKWSKGDKEFFKSEFHKKHLQEKMNESRTKSIRKYTSDQEDVMSIRKVSIDKRQREVLPLVDGIYRVLMSVKKFAQKYDPMIWKKNKYLMPDIKLLLENYDMFLKKLYEKDCRVKTQTKKRGIYLPEFFKILLCTQGSKTREMMVSAEIAFSYAKSIFIEDGKAFCLSFEEFCQALARLADSLSLAPIGLEASPVFQKELARKECPLVFKLESFLQRIYLNRLNDFGNPKLNTMFENGIFSEESAVYAELAAQRYNQDNTLVLDGRVNTKIKLNNFGSLSYITLRDLIDNLKQKYENVLVKRYSIVDELHQVDD